MIASDNRVQRSNEVSRRPRWRRLSTWFWGLLILIAAVLASAIYAAHQSVGYYVITPGDATPVSNYITVPRTADHRLSGNILLTDVFVTPLNELSYLRYKYFDNQKEIWPTSALLGSTVNEQQYLEQGYLQMAQAQDAAKATALRHLGHSVASSPAGALVYGIVPRSPGARSLKVGEVVMAVDGRPTTSSCALVAAISDRTPGSIVTLTVRADKIGNSGQITPGPVVQEKVRLAKPPNNLTHGSCGEHGPPHSYLGIDPEDELSWYFPVSVSLHTADIGGPSAGLAMALGIMDELSTGRITKGRVVAATGEIDSSGKVYEIGGVAEKAVAAERAGASIFFVPQGNYAAARSKSDSHFHVYGVRSLDDVLRILDHS